MAYLNGQEADMNDTGNHGQLEDSADTLRVLLLEDNPLDSELTLQELRNGGFNVSADMATNAEDFTRRVQTNQYHIILADYTLPQWTGMDALQVLRGQSMDTPLILVTGSLGEEKAVECLKQGATDYVLKDRICRLPLAVRRALEEKRLRQEHREAEADLARKVKELARSNAELEQLAYVASHDLQEPLRIVSSYTQLLAKRYQGQLGPDADEYIRYAVDGANRMSALIRDLLQFSRFGFAELQPPQSTELSVMVDWALLGLQTAVQESGAEITQGALPALSVDQSQMPQVFPNLTENPTKPRRAEEPPRIHIPGSREGDEWTIAVQD